MDDLAGVLGLLATVHQKPKEKHQRDEELTADSPSHFARAEKQQRGARDARQLAPFRRVSTERS